MKSTFLTQLMRYPGTSGIALFVLMAAINVAVEPSALSAYNLSSTLQIALPLVLGTIAQTLIMIAGGIDLSIGGVMSLTNAVIAVASPSMVWPAPWRLRLPQERLSAW